MLDKSWISFPRSAPQYIHGLNRFLDFAFSRSSIRGKIACPCEKCKFKKWQTRDDVYAHCMRKQFPKYYRTWIYHGELHNNNDAAANFEVGSSSQVGIQVEASDVAEHAQTHPIINNALSDALALQGDTRDGEEDVLGPEAEYLRNEAARNFFELMEADTPLYPGIYSIYLLRVIITYRIY